VRKSRESILNDLKKALRSQTPTERTVKYFVSLPTEEAHHQVHKTGGMHAMAQRVYPKVAAKIHELVASGLNELPEVKRAFKLYVNSLPEPPCQDDRAYYPTNSDISNHIFKARAQMQLSKLDQENLAIKVNEWKQSKKGANIYFRPYRRKAAQLHQEQCNESHDSVSMEYEQTLLWAYQEPWQQDLMINYGNTITLIDTTYKTTKYELPLFFSKYQNKCWLFHHSNLCYTS